MTALFTTDHNHRRKTFPITIHATCHNTSAKRDHHVYSSMSARRLSFDESPSTPGTPPPRRQRMYEGTPATPDDESFSTAVTPSSSFGSRSPPTPDTLPMFGAEHRVPGGTLHITLPPQPNAQPIPDPTPMTLDQRHELLLQTQRRLTLQYERIKPKLITDLGGLQRLHQRSSTRYDRYATEVNYIAAAMAHAERGFEHFSVPEGMRTGGASKHLSHRFG